MLNRAPVLQFFAEHDWVASVAELRRLGVSTSALCRSRAAGAVVDVAPRVVAVAHVELTLRGWARAGLLAAGHDAFISGGTAGLLYGLRSMPTKRVEITIHERHRAHLPNRFRLAYTSWIDEARDVRHLGGLRVASPLRTLFGLAGQFNQFRFERAAEDAWHRQLVEPADAAAYLRAIRRAGKGGVLRFERWLERTAERTRASQSGLELDMVDIVRRAGLPEPERRHPLRLASGELVHLDLAWPRILLAFEPGHTWWHGGDLQQRRDEERDQACGELGWAVHRFDEEQMADEVQLVARVGAIYRARAALLTG